MKRFFKLLGIYLLVSLWSFSVRAADVTLMPVAVKLDRANDRATVQVMNNGQEPVLMQAEAIAWNRVGGIDIDGPTTDVIVNPPVFTVQPGQTQVLRLGLRRSQQLEQEATYRIVLREVPMPRPSDVLNVAGSVRVLVALRVPVYVAPAQVKRGEQWKVTRAPNGELLAQVSNTGNVHVKVSELRLQGEGGTALASLAQKGSHSVIFPGEQRTFRLPATAQATQVLVQTDEGQQVVALNEPREVKP
ncbi:fimbria/pilus periplasmic chaperone [Roseateles asaccharophilus]|uniref:Fimbrial chaperone protein n=1 Tax=Roseateles asaccharophilus TaxID=582607 RepID=A0ABU2A3W2_9BURK|nr:fimbria/pilus periplasmic chaperone [Roseateles asaccharophilus]MDR7331881.1 fimbrial chaperone protein [Roseateles asaccharophilus]